jgi:dienelactone hydrolase
VRTVQQEQLITAIAEDGVDLDGMLIRPSSDEPQILAVWIHGFGANFCFAPYVELARALAACGVAVALVNTRGHDLATLLRPRMGTPYWGGAAWELLDESPRDLAGWIDAAADAGFAGVVLIGHSLGTVKVTHYLAERHDPRVLGLALAAPALQPAWDTRAHPDALAEAERLVRGGHPEALFAGPWGPVSAQTYLSLDRVGFDQFGRTTNEPNLARIARPIFAVIGAEDVQVCTAADLEVIRRNARTAPRVETHIIEGSDHFFTGHAADVASLLARWIATLS